MLVDALDPGSPSVGKLRPNDVIVSVDGKRVRSRSDLLRLVGAHKPGEDVAITVKRGDKQETVTIRTRPIRRTPSVAVIGVFVEQAAAIKLPLDVKIDIGNVGGPSAGLAFALDVMEELGPDVDGGHKIAATGEIELDGASPRRRREAEDDRGPPTGIDVFLVPAGDNARRAAPCGRDPDRACEEFSTGVAGTGNIAGSAPGLSRFRHVGDAAAKCGAFVGTGRCAKGKGP